MCAKLLACPLCSQPAFLTLDALRIGLISVATRPLACPVCNEVLLGVDKLTIHLFSHAINLANDNTEKNNADNNGRIVCENFCKQNEEEEEEGNMKVRNEHIETWNFVNGKQSSDKDDRTKLPSEEIRQVAITPLRKIANARDLSTNTKNNTISTSSQTCSSGDSIRSELDSIPLITPTSQIIFVQSSQQQVVDNQDVNGFSFADEILVQSISEDRQTSGFNDGKPESHQRNEEETERLKHVQANSDCEKNYAKSILQFQPAWTNSQNICIENGREILTITQKAVQQNEDKVLTPASSTAQTNIEEVTRKIDDSENQRRSPDQSQVLPQLKAFKAIATKEKTERCDVCGFYFSDPNILTLHKQLVHMINEKDLNRKPEDLLKNYPCHLCPKVFKMRGSLMVHMRVAHIGYNLGSLPKDGDPLPIPGEHGYDCPTCGKNFKKEQHVTQHLKTHDGKQWECDVCSKMFTTKYFLKKHKRLHSGEMPYKCNICEKTFTFQQSYHKHRLYHKDDKPHGCSTCGRSFKELSTLHNHERIHTGEKPFACETCGKCFRQRVSYLVHRRIHTGAMPYKCTACGKSFRYRVSQRTHKCTAQPPGTVVRQSSDLVQRLLQVSQIRDSALISESGEGASAQENESNGVCVPNEDNRYILIINNQGQHVLTRQSEIENKTVGRMEAERSSDLNKYEKETNGETYIEDLWGHDIPDGTTLKDSMEMSEKNNSVGASEFRPDGNNDFFSMVLSPEENGAQSPSSGMEHLRLSSPTSSNETIVEMKKPPRVLQETNNFHCGTSKAMVQDNFGADNNRVALTLPTINEESLKQLLYGTETGE